MLTPDLTRIRIDEAIRMTGVSEGTFRRHIYGSFITPLLAGFPPPCAKGRRLLWIRQDILDWLNSQRTFVPPRTQVPQIMPAAIQPVADAPVQAPPAQPTKRRGRPPNLSPEERIAAFQGANR